MMSKVNLYLAVKSAGVSCVRGRDSFRETAMRMPVSIWYMST